MSANQPPPPAEMVTWAEVEKFMAALGIVDASKVWSFRFDRELMLLTVTRVRLNEAGFKVGKAYDGHLQETFEVNVR